MTYKIDTKVEFSCNVGREVIKEEFMLKDLGFTEENLQTYTVKRIENDIQELFLDWQDSYLDSGWVVIEQ